MENEKTLPTTREIGIRYGIFTMVASIVFFLIITLTGQDMNGPWKWFGYIISLVFVFLAHKAFKESGNGYMAFGQGVGISFWMSLVSAIGSSIFTYFYIKFIDSGFVEKIKDVQIAEMEKKGMSEEQIDQAMKIASMFMTPEAILIFGIVFGIIGMVICGLIISIFTQKKDPNALTV